MKKVLLFALAGMFSLAVVAQTTDESKPAVKTKDPVKVEKKAPPALKVSSQKATQESKAKPPQAKDPVGKPPQSQGRDKHMSEIKVNDLPKAAIDWMSTNVPNGKITRAGKIDEKGVLTYVAVMHVNGYKHAYMFDKEGKFTGKGDHLFPGKGKGPRPKAQGTTR